MHRYKALFILCLSFLCVSCGFHLQGRAVLAPPLRHLYLQAVDPYGALMRNLKESLKMSNVDIVSSPEQASTHLVILVDNTSQDLLSVSGTQQTRQYNLKVTVVFEMTDNVGRIIMPSQTLTETRVITVQSNQVLGSSNEVNLFYQQMRRALAYAIMNRIASKEVTRMVMDAEHINPAKP